MRLSAILWLAPCIADVVSVGSQPGQDAWIAPRCASREEMTYNCPANDLSEELLSKTAFGGADGRGEWNWNVWEQDAAKFSFGPEGAQVAVEKLSPQSMLYDIGLNKQVEFAANSSVQYLLCVQAGASVDGLRLRFAIDNGKAPDWSTPGLLPRHVMELKSDRLSSSCFSFVLDPAVAKYSGRIAIEMGETLGQISVCEVSLRYCRQQPGGGLPWGGKKIDEAAWVGPQCQAEEDIPYGCSDEDLSEELLGDQNFAGTGAQQVWTGSMWDQGAARFSFGSEGARVAVDKLSSAQMLYDVGLNRPVHFVADASVQYLLCVQAGASVEGLRLRFAIDDATPPDWLTPGRQPRQVMALKSGGLSTNCFRFVLDPAATEYSGRITLEMGASLGQVSVCKVSLKSCRKQTSIQGALDAVRRCYVAPLTQVPGGCSKKEVLLDDEFGLNHLCQETDGKRRCLENLRKLGGDTFAYSPGRCELWDCSSRHALLKSASAESGMHVYSKHCDYQESMAGRYGRENRVPVFVKLWEWTYNDVAQECVEFLGPNGFDAVQVSPVVEHIQSGSWFARYQPASFLLNSRSGNADDLKRMVATCRAHGVEVIVDVVLNHIARDCPLKSNDFVFSSTLPCQGYAGSRYGTRQLADASQDLFHHHAVSTRFGECGVDKNFQCPNSTLAGECTHCDLFGLPDWDTASPIVQEKLIKHLQDLHSIGVSMIRLDAAIYIDSKELSQIINRVPWDFVFQEWWQGVPLPSRTEYVGNYRDVFFGRKINKALVLDEVDKLPQLLGIQDGIGGLRPQNALYPLTFHDQRSFKYEPGTPTYKGGLEFHQQQKFLLASPHGHLVRLWGSFGWTNLDDGPPGCSKGDTRCEVKPVFDDTGSSGCMPTPFTTPLPQYLADSSRWVCEHRWEGVAGLIEYRKHCLSENVTKVWNDGVSQGNLAWRMGISCFAALQRKMKPQGIYRGHWFLKGMSTGLPEGRYCDLGSLTTKKGWNGKSCPREVLLGAGGVVLHGYVPEGDLLAIHEGARLDRKPDAAAKHESTQAQATGAATGMENCKPVLHQLPANEASSARRQQPVRSCTLLAAAATLARLIWQ